MISFKEFITEVTKKPAPGAGGRDYESKVVSSLQKGRIMDPEAKAAGASGDAPDAHMNIGGKTHDLEIKADNNAMFGQLEIHHDGKRWNITPKAAERYAKTAAHPAVQKFLRKINKTWGKPTGDYEKDLKMGNVYHEHGDTSPIVAHYHHDRKTPYVHMGKGSGLHHFHRDPGNLGTPKLTGTTKLRARFKARGRDKNGKRTYGSLIVFSLGEKPNSSSIDLDKTSHIKKIASGK